MSCEEYQLLIIDRDEHPLSEGQAERLDAHLRTCPDCRDFEAGRRTIRAAIRRVLPVEPPAALDAETLRLGLEADRRTRGGSRPLSRHAGLPAPILLMLGLLTALTVVWLGITLADFDPSQTWRPATVAAVVLIAQNALTLFVAPVLLRKKGGSRDETDMI